MPNKNSVDVGAWRQQAMILRTTAVCIEQWSRAHFISASRSDRMEEVAQSLRDAEKAILRLIEDTPKQEEPECPKS